MKTKSQYKRAADLLDKVFSLYIRIRDRRKYGNCPICSKRPIECCFHFFPRKNLATRWEPDACCGSCSGCNYEECMRRGIYKSDNKFREAHVRLIGEQRRNELELQKSLPFKKSAEELMDIKRNFENMLAKENHNGN